MEPTDEQGLQFPSQAEEVESNRLGIEAAEELASMRWQREDGGRISRQDIGRRIPTLTPHRVTAMPGAVAGQAGDSDDDEEGGDASGIARRPRRTSIATREERSAQQEIEIQNQQVGAPPGAGVLLGGPMLTIPHSTTSTSRQFLSSSSADQPRQPPPDLYPVLTPLQQSASAERTSGPPIDAADATFLDDDFQECWWATEQEDGTLSIVRGWATRHGDWALVYLAGGALWAGTQEDYRILYW